MPYLVTHPVALGLPLHAIYIMIRLTVPLTVLEADVGRQFHDRL